jgi:hypothetical protein
LPGVWSPSVARGATAVSVLQKQQNGGGHIYEAGVSEEFCDFITLLDTSLGAGSVAGAGSIPRIRIREAKNMRIRQIRNPNSALNVASLDETVSKDKRY